MIFHDQQDKGLTFKSDTVVVKVQDANKKEYEVTGGYQIVTPEGEATALDDKCTFEISIPDVKQLEFAENAGFTGADITADCKIIVEYKSELNSNAVLGSTGNLNKVQLQYSTDVNYSYTPGETPDDTPEYSEWDEVIVFTYTTVVNKTNAKGDALGGAEFTLYKLDPTNKDADSEGWVALSAVKTNNGSTFTFSGLDDGDYKLEETAAPAGFTGIDPIEFTVYAVHTEDTDTPKVSFKSLNATTDATGATILTDASGGNIFTSSNGTLTTTVKNTSNGSLPETGGIGTKIFYAVGGVIAITAVILLITRKRMKNQTH